MSTRVLDAFEQLLIDGGVRAATLDAVAAAVGLSRSGVLHHFPSRSRMVDGLIDRFTALVDEDVAFMRSDIDSAVEYYVLSSLNTDAPLERVVSAVARLAQGGEARAAVALRDSRERWYEVLCEAVGDPMIAKLVLFVGDGMAHHVDMAESVAADPFLNEGQLRKIIGLVQAI